MGFKDLMNSGKQWASVHSPEIWMGIGIGAFVGGVIFGIMATPKAVQLMDEKKEELDKDKLTPWETIKTTWKCYLPCVISCIGGIACVVNADEIHHKRNAALAAAYTMSETALTEYQSKVIDEIGEKKEKKIEEKLNEDKVNSNPPTDSNIENTGLGNTLCYDVVSSRYFRCDINVIHQAEARCTSKLHSNIDNTVTINDFYDEIGLEEMQPYGEYLVWRLTSDLTEIKVSPQSMNAENGEPVFIIAWPNGGEPKWDIERIESSQMVA